MKPKPFKICCERLPHSVVGGTPSKFSGSSFQNIMWKAPSIAYTTGGPSKCAVKVLFKYTVEDPLSMLWGFLSKCGEGDPFKTNCGKHLHNMFKVSSQYTLGDPLKICCEGPLSIYVRCSGWGTLKYPISIWICHLSASQLLEKCLYMPELCSMQTKILNFLRFMPLNVSISQIWFLLSAPQQLQDAPLLPEV